MMSVSVVTLGLLIFEHKSYSQNILGLKVAAKSGRPQKKPRGLIKTMSDGPWRDWICGWVGEGRNNVPNQPKQSNNAAVKMLIKFNSPHKYISLSSIFS